MSCHYIYYENGAKKMRPVLSREQYMALRNTSRQQAIIQQVRSGKDTLKHQLVQMNYSCLPNPDGTLKGSTTPSNSVGMDVDHIEPSQMEAVRDRILAHREELALLMLELSARGQGYHLVFRRRPELSQEENLRWASDLLGVEYDPQAKDITRVFFTTTGSAEDLIYLSNELFETTPAETEPNVPNEPNEPNEPSPALPREGVEGGLEEVVQPASDPLSYLGIPYSKIIDKWWELYYEGQQPVKSNRNERIFSLAFNLRHITGFDRQLLDKVIPCYDGFPQAEKMRCIDSALSEKMTQLPIRMREVLKAVRQDMTLDPQLAETAGTEVLDDVLKPAEERYAEKLPAQACPMGVADSLGAAPPAMAMAMLTAICPAIGTLATGLQVAVHGQMNTLNLIAFIAGNFSSNKSLIDTVVEAWMSEIRAQDKLYEQQEDEYRAKKRAAKNAKQQPEEPNLPVRFVTMNNTVANIAARLANTLNQHAFSFTPEADNVALKWKQSISDFSVMIRQAYDASRYEREARSADAVNVHIEHLRWNVVMCGTQDALYRVVTNYTDGFQSRIAVARTPDNTYQPLEEHPYLLTTRQQERIQQVAHLLPLMKGEVELNKLEQRSRQWLETIRLEAIKDDDRVLARQRMRVCVTAMRMTACLMLCLVAERLIRKHGLLGAEMQLRQQPSLTAQMLVKAQTPAMMEAFDVIANYLLYNALYFFRDRIEQACQSADMTGSQRVRQGKNKSIFARLSDTFSLEQLQHLVFSIKGSKATVNSVYQMIKNWKNQGLIEQTEKQTYQKLS